MRPAFKAQKVAKFPVKYSLFLFLIFFWHFWKGFSVEIQKIFSQKKNGKMFFYDERILWVTDEGRGIMFEVKLQDHCHEIGVLSNHSISWLRLERPSTKVLIMQNFMSDL